MLCCPLHISKRGSSHAAVGLNVHNELISRVVRPRTHLDIICIKASKASLDCVLTTLARYIYHMWASNHAILQLVM